MDDLNNKRLLNKITGCLVGGAVGDALGYPIEFYDYDRIRHDFGEDGITTYTMPRGIAEISDDTQMTLYTACGLLNGYASGVTIKSPEVLSRHYVWEAYEEWHALQISSKPVVINPVCDISHLKAMQDWRAPGMTCMYALREKKPGSLAWHVNDSKGCGGIMRVAPVALINDPDCSAEEKAHLGAEIAALTHGHSLGFIPAAMMVYLLNEIVYPTRKWGSLGEVTDYVWERIHLLYGKKYGRTKYMLQMIRHAIELAEKNLFATDEEAISLLGEGKVAEETLAIAIYCCLKYPDDFEKAVIASVNHGGDSDSTGAVTGNILGAWLGYEAIHPKFTDYLEEVDTIEDVANRLYSVEKINHM